MAKRTTAKRKAELKVAEAPEAPTQIPLGMQDAELGKVIIAKITWQLQVQLDDGTWDLYGMPTADREALQLTQDFRARKFPEERRRVIEHDETWVVVDIEEPGRDPGPLPEADINNVGSFRDRLKEIETPN